MKLLQVVTKGLFSSKEKPLKNDLKVENSKTKTVISKAFSTEDEDFLFI